jgi:cellulose synthase/poly-beta-1,6-N-acetylglucosamine synthase-like glycosyltransferase
MGGLVSEQGNLLEMLATLAIFLAWLFVVPFVAVSLYLSLEILFGLKALPRRRFEGRDNLNIAVLVPAHNEASGIASTVAALRSAMPRARLLVVADNCTDETASFAIRAGAEVVERHDPTKRGKGFALEFGRDHLRTNPPAVVIVLDADCRIQKWSGEMLATAAFDLERPVQSANLLASPQSAPALEGISNFAMLVKNLVRARGLMRLGGGITLFGTGMAFPWPLFSQLDLASAALAEDLELGLHLARKGIRVDLIDQAMVTSPAASVADSREQRRRWEHGFLHQAKKSALPLLGLGIRRGSRHLLGLGAHMLVPPIAMHMLLGMAVMAATAPLALGDQAIYPFLAAAIAMSVLLILLFLAWLKEGRRVLPLRALALAPIYVAWKVPIYLGLFLKRQTAWKRTRRPDER